MQDLNSNFNPKSCLFVGDTHQHELSIKFAYCAAVATGAEAVFVVGDFGYWPNSKDGKDFLYTCSYNAAYSGIPCIFIAGNHENWDKLESDLQARDYNNKFVEVEQGLWFVPQSMSWTWQEKKFVGIGGAYSVDSHLRTKYVSHFPQETINGSDIEVALAHELCDVVVAHDTIVEAPPYYKGDGPWHYGAHKNSQANRKVLSEICKELNPSWLVHGHHHQRVNSHVGPRLDARLPHTIGLNCNDKVDPFFYVDLTQGTKDWTWDNSDQMIRSSCALISEETYNKLYELGIEHLLNHRNLRK